MCVVCPRRCPAILERMARCQCSLNVAVVLFHVSKEPVNFVQTPLKRLVLLPAQIEQRGLYRGGGKGLSRALFLCYRFSSDTELFIEFFGFRLSWRTRSLVQNVLSNVCNDLYRNNFVTTSLSLLNEDICLFR